MFLNFYCFTQSQFSITLSGVCLCVFQLFLASMAFVYFAKAFAGSYMKSSITQIERRFDLSSTHIGLIDGSFEMGIIYLLI